MITKAMVTVKLQIEVDDTWSSTTTVDQIRKQSKDSAMHILNKMLDQKTGVSLAGVKSTVIMLEE